MSIIFSRGTVFHETNSGKKVAVLLIRNFENIRFSL